MTAKTKRVTAADVARSLGLSRATVGFVLNNTPGQTISEATRARVLAEAERLGYRPHTAARALASGKSRIVLVLLPDWPLDHAMRAHLEEAATTLDAAGYSMVSMVLHSNSLATPLWEILNPDVIFSLTELDDARYHAIQATGARTVIPGRDDAATLARDLHFAEGPQEQVRHLVETGRRNLAFASTPDPRLQQLAEQRFQLAARTLAALGHGELPRSEITADTAPEVVGAWRAQGVDAVVGYNDDIAALVLGAALRSGLDVPGQLAIVGHDDTPLASLLVPALSSVRVDAAGLGRYLAQIALAAATQSPFPQAGPAAHAVLVRRETS